MDSESGFSQEIEARVERLVREAEQRGYERLRESSCGLGADRALIEVCALLGVDYPAGGDAEAVVCAVREHFNNDTRWGAILCACLGIGAPPKDELRERGLVAVIREHYETKITEARAALPEGWEEKDWFASGPNLADVWHRYADAVGDARETTGSETVRRVYLGPPEPVDLAETSVVKARQMHANGWSAEGGHLIDPNGARVSPHSSAAKRASPELIEALEWVGGEDIQAEPGVIARALKGLP